MNKIQLDQLPSIQQKGILLAIVFLLSWIHFFFFHGGYFGYDELEYMRLADCVLKGNFYHDSLYAFRYAVFLPLALLYDVFGMGDFANWLLEAGFLMLIAIVLLEILSGFKFWVRFVSMLLLVCSPMHLLFLEKPMPDIVTEFGFIVCFYAYYLERFKKENPATYRNTGLFCFGFVMIFLSKETFLIIYPFFLIMGIVDIIRKERTKFWMGSGISIAVFLLLYFASYQLFMGNALARIDAIFTNRYISACTYELQPVAVVLKRIAYDGWLEMVRNGFLLPLGFAFVLLFRKKSEASVNLFFVYSWLAVLLLSNFMTISYTAYVPLCDDPRHFKFAIPLGIAVWAWGWQQSSTFSLKEKLMVALFWIVQLILSIYLVYEHKWFLFIPLLIALFISGKVQLKGLKVFLVTAGILAIFLQNGFYNLEVNHFDQKKLIEKVLNDGTQPKWILTDAANTSIGNFYAGYDSLNQFVSFDEFKPEFKNERDCYLIFNGMTAYFSNMDWGKIPQFALTTRDSTRFYYENKSGQVFKIPKN